jgi:serine/threonine protein kinase
MEYLDGQSLRARLDSAPPLPVGDAVRIAGETADALAAAHDKGIVHRDLKPENIFLVRREAGADSVKVLDFGISKLRADVAHTLARTQTGAVLGTPQYMSPEHCRGASTVDHRADIYSLGVILYEMVCGRPPFRADVGIGQLIHLHLTTSPAPPRTIVPELPAAIESIILRCMAKSAADRFASMPEVARALRAALADDTVDDAVATAGGEAGRPAAGRTGQALPSRGSLARRAIRAVAAVGRWLSGC